MNGATPAWFRLLRNYTKRPTLPFIIGALRECANVISREGDAFEQTSTLMNEMAKYRTAEDWPWVIHVEYCGMLEVPVFSLGQSDRSSRACFPAATPLRARLCFDNKIAGPHDSGLPEIVDTLFYGYEHPHALEQKHYSRDPGGQSTPPRWRPFNDADLLEISKALGVAYAPSEHG